MEHDPNGKGHLPSRVPVMRLLGSPVQEIFCPASLVFARPARKNQVESAAREIDPGHSAEVSACSGSVPKSSPASVIDMRKCMQYRAHKMHQSSNGEWHNARKECGSLQASVPE